VLPAGDVISLSDDNEGSSYDVNDREDVLVALKGGSESVSESSLWYSGKMAPVVPEMFS
jgi:hypothetical protein